MIDTWRAEYNDERPKKILGGLTPAQKDGFIEGVATSLPLCDVFSAGVG